jgi:hypothetical protein
MGVAAVNDNVARLQVGLKLFNDLIYRFTGGDKEDDFAWPFQQGHKPFNGLGSLDGPIARFGQQLVYFVVGSVVTGYSKAVVGHVQKKVPPHCSQAN